jgi:TPR repeat protein
MLLIVAAAAALSPPPSDTYRFGGGQAWIAEGASQDCAHEHYTCAVVAFGKHDTETALVELQAAARDRDVRAMREIGLMYLRGDVFRRDNAAAVGWFYEAAMAGDRESMRLLGLAFQRGIGVRRDRDLAAYWLTRAAVRR